ncbi:MAG: ribonuclease E/G [Paracoccaceae bacterium]
MAKKMLIDATHAEETRVVVVDGNKVEEFDFETVNKRQLAGNIYLAKITRVEPSLQAAFVDYGGNRHGFLAFAEIHPDYYQIPVADRKALLEEERAFAKAMDDDEQRDGDGGREGGRGRNRRRRGGKAADARNGDAVKSSAPVRDEAEIGAMDVIDLGDDAAEAASHETEADQTPADAPVTAAAETAAPVANEADVAPAAPAENGGDSYSAVDHAAELDDEIRSVAEEDVAEEIRQPRKPRPRKYKIQEVVKVRQIMLVQVVKEERGNKGAALTTYLSLAGRYCVLMPNTARGGGISRKITNAADRKKLKEIAHEIEVPDGAGLIIRTAGAKRNKAEIKRDYEYLMRLWEQIRDLTMKSIAPAPIYEEGNLIKRSIRDLYNRDIDEVLVEGAEGYRLAKDFMKMIMPSHAKNVKQYGDAMPLFARYQVESYLSAMFNPVVQLKSGGYIVIGVTEALVAIDVNSGRATKEGSIEDTALKTNLEAAEEVARQLRLRDLAGLIVIDFIDMEERKNNAAVEKRLKDKLKTDRARIQVGRISGFGLLEMSRQRLRPGMLEATTAPCPHCHGTGLIRSDDSLALSILRQLEEEGTRKRSREVLLKAPVAVANFLMNQKREHIAQIEMRYGMAIRVEADPSLISPDFAIEKFKTATRVVAEMAFPVVSVDTSLMPDLVDEDEADDSDQTEAQADDSADNDAGSDQPRKKRRRRRRRRGGGQGEGQGEGQGDTDNGQSDAAADDDGVAEGVEPVAAAADAEAEAKPAKKPGRSRRSRGKKADAAPEAEAAPEAPAEAKPVAEVALPEAGEAEAEEQAEKPAKRTRKTPARKAPARKKTAKDEAPVDAEAEAPAAVPAPAPATPDPAPAATEPEPAPQPEPVAAMAEPEPEDDDRPKKRGWWSLGR